MKVVMNVFVVRCQVISECCALLEKECVSLSTHVRVLPLHVDLSAPAAQQVYEVEEECVRRRVILTDVLGESSFSLNNIRYVIDTGLQLKTVSLSSSYKHLINISPSYSTQSTFTDLQPTNQSRFTSSTANQ